jgi:hypothetical protein
MDDDSLGCIVTLVALVLVFVLALIVGVTNEPVATRVLTDEGISEIHFTGYDMWGCSDDDWYHTGFTGVHNGRPVSGVVCSGLFFKGNTIRYH